MIYVHRAPLIYLYAYLQFRSKVHSSLCGAVLDDHLCVAHHLVQAFCLLVPGTHGLPQLLHLRHDLGHLCQIHTSLFVGTLG